MSLFVFGVVLGVLLFVFLVCVVFTSAIQRLHRMHITIQEELAQTRTRMEDLEKQHVTHDSNPKNSIYQLKQR